MTYGTFTTPPAPPLPVVVVVVVAVVLVVLRGRIAMGVVNTREMRITSPVEYTP